MLSVDIGRKYLGEVLGCLKTEDATAAVAQAVLPEAGEEERVTREKEDKLPSRERERALTYVAPPLPDVGVIMKPDIQNTIIKETNISKKNLFFLIL